MSSLMSLFNEIIGDYTKWDYYNKFWIRNLDFIGVMRDPSFFITNYLSNGDKMNIRTSEQIESLARECDRLEHTISIFFFGILLYEKVDVIKNNIDRFIGRNKRFIDDEEVTPFSYYWFLICFFHDLGYYFENKDFKFVFSKLAEFQENGISLRLPPFSKGIPNIIVRNWGKYLKYRIDEMGCIDHGVIGGVLFYYERLKDYTLRKNHFQRAIFIQNGLKWSNTILRNIHLPVAWTILAHNMWFINEESEHVDKYIRYNLNDLIRNEPAINIVNHPLLYLLSVVDSLDPIKCLRRFGIANSIDEITSTLHLEFNRDSFYIQINNENSEAVNKYFDSIKKMNAWIRCSVNSNNSGLEFEIY